MCEWHLPVPLNYKLWLWDVALECYIPHSMYSKYHSFFFLYERSNNPTNGISLGRCCCMRDLTNSMWMAGYVPLYNTYSLVPFICTDETKRICSLFTWTLTGRWAPWRIEATLQEHIMVDGCQLREILFEEQIGIHMVKNSHTDLLFLTLDHKSKVTYSSSTFFSHFISLFIYCL